MNATCRRIVCLALLLPAMPALRAQDPRPLPALEQATAIWDCTGDDVMPMPWDGLLDRLARVDAVFLGETHLDDTTHRVELHVLDRLLELRQGKVVLSLEMFERDVQPVLDDYLQGRIDETAFLARSRPWSNYQTAYRPLVERARAAGIPVVAANFPAAVRRRLAMGGKQALDALPAELRAFVPDEVFPASVEYWERVDRAVRGHMGARPGGSPEERLYEGQNLWDNAMGDAVSKALAAHPGHLVLHVAGGFHVAYRDGTVAQFLRRAPGATAAVVSIAPVPGLYAARPDRDREQADFMVYALAIGRDLWEETHAVAVPAELRYRLAVPDGAAGLPLLVWLPDRGTRPEDALATWTAALGDMAAVAVVEHAFPELQDDLARGGRWVFGDGFRADYGRVQHGLAQIVEYAIRRLPVDRSRVVVAGAGDGGAAVLWTAMYGDWLDVDMVAFEPTDLARLGMEGLPDRAPATRSLRVVGGPGALQRLAALVADYQKVGVQATVAPLGDGATPVLDAVRSALGLPAPAPVEGAPVLLVLDTASPRAREWAGLEALRLRQRGTAARVVTAAEVPADADAGRIRRLRVGDGGRWPVAHFAQGAGLPLAGGPFGGTTVLVLPAGTSDADRAAWEQVEQGRAIKRRSMFANLRLARADGEPSLATVLDELRRSGKSRVLVVPAAFCVDGAAMQDLRRQAGAAAEGLDLHWLPGMGGELVQ